MYTVRPTDAGLFYIQHPRSPGLAWSHVAGGWVQHSDAIGESGLDPIRFETEQDADDYATDNYLYPRRD